MKINEVTLFKIRVYGSNHSKRIEMIVSGTLNLRYGSYWYIATLLLNRHVNDELLTFIKKYFPRYFIRRTLNKFSPVSHNPVKLAQTSLHSQKECIFYVGDSHAEFWSRIPSTKKSAAVHALHIGPVLANTFAKDDNKIQCITSFLHATRKTFLFEKVCLVLIFGEIDIRAHSWTQVNLYKKYKNFEGYASCLASKFVSAAKRLKLKVTKEIDWSKIDIAIRRQVPPSDCSFFIPPDKKSLHNIFEINKAPVLGSPGDRVMSDNLLWEEIKKACSANNIICQDLPSYLFAANGTLDPKFSEDSCHVTNMNSILDTHNSLLNMLNYLAH